jgi:hypothetical protein
MDDLLSENEVKNRWYSAVIRRKLQRRNAGNNTASVALKTKSADIIELPDIKYDESKK